MKQILFSLVQTYWEHHVSPSWINLSTTGDTCNNGGSSIASTYINIHINMLIVLLLYSLCHFLTNYDIKPITLTKPQPY